LNGRNVEMLERSRSRDGRAADIDRYGQDRKERAKYQAGAFVVTDPVLKADSATYHEIVYASRLLTGFPNVALNKE
jgi:hypothetical protein